MSQITRKFKKVVGLIITAIFMERRERRTWSAGSYTERFTFIASNENNAAY